LAADDGDAFVARLASQTSPVSVKKAASVTELVFGLPRIAFIPVPLPVDEILVAAVRLLVLDDLVNLVILARLGVAR
jgi:hypothetical protein